MVELVQDDLLSGVTDNSLHLVVSNPPYVGSEDMATLASDVRGFEPVTALEAGPGGLDVIRRLLPEAARALRPGGSVLLEVGDKQAAAVEVLAREAGFVAVAAHKDLSGKDRIVQATLPGAYQLTTEGMDEATQTALAAALREGAVIGMPTDTVYGLAARWDSPAGVRGLFVAKGRAEEQIVAAVFASVDQVEAALLDLEPCAAQVMRALLPGPYTFIVKTEVPRTPLVGTADSLGVRVPDHAALLQLVASLGTPLALTSANLTGQKDAATVDEVDPLVLAHCSAVFVPPAGAGPPAAGVASTIVDLRPLTDGAAPTVLREGAVPAAEVLARIAGAREPI
jgi:L-threonylcarbamoyladenylate synthase